MAEVLVLQHAACEGPGALGALLVRRGHTLRVVRTDRSEPVPAGLGAAGALVVMGGPMGVHEEERHRHLAAERRLIDLALSRELPTLGICLGSQLLAAALGARVYPGARKELGWYPVTLAPAAAADPLLCALPSELTALHWHGDVFDLPAGALSLARSALTEHQAFSRGAAWGLLFHLEVTAPQLARMTRAFAGELAAEGIDPAALLAGAAVHLPALGAGAEAVFGRFAGLIPAR